MSYCRWSSLHHQSDVYVYADCGGGWTTHVAARRRWFRGPPSSLSITRWPKWIAPAAWWFYHHAFAPPWFWLAERRWIDVPQPYAGASYNDATPGECADRLESLRAAGLIVPQYAIDELREESRPRAANGEKHGAE